ncbi:MAG: LamB/YcsF family protein, partial [Nocardioidaceae bacterium]
MPRIIDLNADLGEGVTDDEGLLAVVTSANVACGYHAGGRETMLRVCEEASRRGVAVGAQVSYDDRANFGRVSV